VSDSDVMGVLIPRLVAEHSTLIVAGSGGVGKTTVAAAIGFVAADTAGTRVLVLTVDPAKRLATALGLDDASESACMVDTGGRGELWFEMLDARREWDRLIATHAPDADTRDAVLSNHIYENITRRFVQSHEYVAMERLHQLQISGEWDLIVLDTPPSRNALDLLDAPARMRDFFGGRLLRWLTGPATSRFALQAFRPFWMVADRILGGPFLSDLTEFFVLIKTMEAGFVKRAIEVENSLSDESTSFVIVTTAEPGPVEEVSRLVRELERRRCAAGVVVVNRVTPVSSAEPSCEGESAADMAVRLLPQADSAVVHDVVAMMLDTTEQMTHSARFEAEVLRGLPPDLPAVKVPMMDSDIADVTAMGHLAAVLAESIPAVT